MTQFHEQLNYRTSDRLPVTLLGGTAAPGQKYLLGATSGANHNAVFYIGRLSPTVGTIHGKSRRRPDSIPEMFEGKAKIRWQGTCCEKPGKGVNMSRPETYEAD